MFRLGITQRVTTDPNHGERRDCLDQRWIALADALEMFLIPLPNMPSANVADYITAISPNALILSGGNSLSCLNDSASDAAPERDAFESELINYAIKNRIPIAGICRGMQCINIHLGGSLTEVDGHAGCRHTLNRKDGYKTLFPETVNSYHNWAIRPEELAPGLLPQAFDDEGNVEAYIHTDHSIFGIMWHPERETPLNQIDLNLLRHWLT